MQEMPEEVAYGDPWAERMGRYLAAFTADPDGKVEIATRDLIELARNARDLEAIVLAAPSTHHARLTRAAELIEVVRRAEACPAHLLEGLDDAWKEVANTARIMREADLDEVARILRRKDAEEAQAQQADPTVAELAARALVPRATRLAEQRAASKPESGLP